MDLKAIIGEEALGNMDSAVVDKIQSSWDNESLKLSNALNAERAGREELAKKFKPFDGMNARDVKDSLEFKERYDEDKVNHEEEVQNKIASLENRYKQQLADAQTDWNDEKGKLVKRLEVSDIDSYLRTELAAVAAEPSDIDALIPHYRDRMRLNDSFERTILDKNHNEMLTDSDSAMGMLHSEMNGKFPKLFKSQTPSGSGSGSESTSGGIKGVKEMKASEYEALPLDKRPSLIDENGKQRTDFKIVND